LKGKLKEEYRTGRADRSKKGGGGNQGKKGFTPKPTRWARSIALGTFEKGVWEKRAEKFFPDGIVKAELWKRRLQPKEEEKSNATRQALRWEGCCKIGHQQTEAALLASEHY